MGRRAGPGPGPAWQLPTPSERGGPGSPAQRDVKARATGRNEAVLVKPLKGKMWLELFYCPVFVLCFLNVNLKVEIAPWCRVSAAATCSGELGEGRAWESRKERGWPFPGSTRRTVQSCPRQTARPGRPQSPALHPGPHWQGADRWGTFRRGSNGPLVLASYRIEFPHATRWRRQHPGSAAWTSRLRHGEVGNLSSLRGPSLWCDRIAMNTWHRGFAGALVPKRVRPS